MAGVDWKSAAPKFRDPEAAAACLYWTLALIRPKLRRHAEWLEVSEGYPLPDDLQAALAEVFRVCDAVEHQYGWVEQSEAQP